MENKAFYYSHRFGKKYHLGRSMIEMLGVLAIIGVLSIGGLYAYHQAMERYRLNESFQMLRSFALALAETTETSPNPFSATCSSCNQKYLCRVWGDVFCTTKFPYGEGSDWAVIYDASATDRYPGYFRIRNPTPKLCEAIVQFSKDLPFYSGVQIGNWGVPDQDTTRCFSEPGENIYILFNPKGV